MEEQPIETARDGAPVIWSVAVLGLSVLTVGLLGGDRLLAGADLAPGAVDRTWSGALGVLDLVSGKEIGTFLLGAVLTASALIRNLVKRRPIWSGRLFYVGVVQLICTAAADFAKPPFGRLRPFQALTDAAGSDRWFMGPDYGSFPSGHAAFYAGLFLPLALLFPRWVPALLAVPLLVGAQRVVSHDHYASDVGASFLVAAVVAGGLWRLLEPGRRHHPDARPALAALKLTES